MRSVIIEWELLNFSGHCQTNVAPELTFETLSCFYQTNSALVSRKRSKLSSSYSSLIAFTYFPHSGNSYSFDVSVKVILKTRSFSLKCFFSPPHSALSLDKKARLLLIKDSSEGNTSDLLVDFW